MVKIGQASISENGGINGNAGDTTGTEVYIRDWWDNDWTFVYRPKKTSVARTLVKGMKLACKNDNIGYGQYDRLSLYNELRRMAGNGNIAIEHIKKLATKVNCDCSSLVALLVYISGYRSISLSMTTWNEYEQIVGTGGFEPMNGEILTNNTLLKPGDIIQSEGHTVIVVSNDTDDYGLNLIEYTVYASHPAYEYDTSIAGSYSIDVLPTSFLCLRDGASTSDKVLAHLTSNMVVQCYGYHTGEWYYVVAIIDDTQYIGFANRAYLKRV